MAWGLRWAAFPVQLELTVVRSSKMVFSRGLFHLGCGMFYVYGTYCDMQIVAGHISSYGGRSKYLTFINLVSYLVLAQV